MSSTDQAFNIPTQSPFTLPAPPLTLHSHVTLSNGVRLPLLGYGTSHQGGFSHAAFAYAVRDAGLTLIDTARRYGTEKLIGAEIEKLDVVREQLFITTKIWPADYGYDATLSSLTASLDCLGTSYVDLLLMHWPDCPYWCKDKRQLRADTWRAFEDAYNSGRCKAIGVSNFDCEHLEELLESASVPPLVNQIEFHPYCQPKKLIQFCWEKGIFVQGYSPLAKGAVIDDPQMRVPIEAIANKHQKTLAQVVIRWCLQRGIGCIPKSTKESRIAENSDVFDFELDDNDMKTIDGLAEVGYFKSTWEPKALSRYQGAVSCKLDRFFQVEEIDEPVE